MLAMMASMGMAQNVQVQVQTDPNVWVNPNVNVKIMDKLEAKMEKTLSKSLDKVFKNWEGSTYDQSNYEYQTNEQEIEIPLTSPGERGKLDIESKNGRLTITAYEGKTVKIKMIKYGKKVSKNESKDGMRLISSGSFNVEAQEYRNTVKVENEGWGGGRIDFEVQVPANFDIKAESYNNGHILIEGIDGELNVESYNGPITLKDIKGSASASTYNGAVKVSFISVTADTNMAFSTYNGDVDLTIPGNAKITAKMKTNKDIYTDFDNFDLDESPSATNDRGRRGNYRVKFENWVRGNVNGGGPEVMMKTTNGNIYIRKND